MKTFMKVLSCAILALLLGTGQAFSGDLDMLEQLGQIYGKTRLHVVSSEDSRISFMYYKRQINKSSVIYNLEYAEFDKDGRQVARWDIDLPDLNVPSIMRKGKKGEVFVGLSPLHGQQAIRIYDINGNTVLEDTLSALSSNAPHRTCMSPDGDLLICGWRRDRLFWRVNTAGEHSSFGDAAVREAYHDLGSYYVNEPYLVHMSTNNQILLGSYLVDLSEGPENRGEMYNSLLICAYDIDSNRIVKHREYDLINDPCVGLTRAFAPEWQWLAFTDSAGVTTICGRYRAKDGKFKLFVLAVDRDLNPIETQRRRVERFEDRADYDRSEPHHDFYYLWMESSTRIWLGHIISTPEVIYHAEYLTLQE
jgi:hypothetical protein